MKNLFVSFIRLLAFSLICAGVSAQVEFPAAIEVTGSEEVVFDHSLSAIIAEDIPDAPARAFRDANGKIQLIASHYISYRMIGNDFNSLQKDSTVIMNSHEDSDPSHYNSSEWICGVYTPDGATVHAIIHNEYLPFGASNYATDCFNSLTYAVSSDTGRSYTHAAAPGHFLATIPYQYVHGHPMGIFGGSNIIYNPADGYYYRMVHLEQHLLQDWGAGVIRTQTLDDPRSWRGWDGTGYNVEFIDPYNETIDNRADHIMQPVSRDNIGKMSDGLVYSTYFNKFVVVGPHVKYDPYEDRDVTGFYYAVSEDLINWSSPILIRETTEDWGVGGEWYPTLIDHNDTTRNFEQIGREAYLYFTRWNSGSYDRDLLRLPIRFNKNIVSSFTVNSIGDSEGKNTGDGTAYTGLTNTAGNPEVTLRSAMHEVLSSPDPNYIFTINFNIPGDGPHTIPVGYFLPEMNRSVIIDGFSQPGASENTLSFGSGNDAVIKIELDGSGSGGSMGLAFEGGNSIVKGLALYGFGSGIGISDGNNCTVQGCYIGLDATGASSGNPMGITVGSGGNLIGGSLPADRNVITGEIILIGEDAEHNTIRGNYIGTDASATSTEGAGDISLRAGANNNRIDRNCISGTYRGVEIMGSASHSNIVVNNVMGTDKTGTIGLSSGLIGIYLADGCYDNVIGKPDSGNVIGSWTVGGIAIDGSGTSGNLIQGNYIGCGSDGETRLGNGHPAVYVFNGAGDNTIGGTGTGEGNLIAYNSGDAIFLDSDAGTGNAILGNAIFDNGFGIDLYPDGVNSNDELDSDTGPNNAQNAPELTGVMITEGIAHVQGRLKTEASTSYYLEFFETPSIDENGYAQGKRRVHTKYITTAADGYATIDININDSLTAGSYLTVTQMDPNNNSSEFSNAVIILSDVDFPDIAVSAASVDFPSINPTQMLDENVDINNNGTLPLIWTVEKDAPWIRLDKEGGTLAAGASTILNITVDPQGMTSGTHEAIVVIRSNDPDQSSIALPVSMTINGDADIEVSPLSLDKNYLSESTYSETLLISNTGTTLLESYFHSSDEWISFTPSWKQTQAGATDTIRVDINTAGLAPGNYDAWLRVDHNVPQTASITIPFQIGIISEGPYFTITPDSLYTLMNVGDDSLRTCIIENPGSDTLTWAASCTDAWITLLPLSGTVDPGARDTLQVNINMTGREAGLYVSQIDVTSNDSSHSLVTVPVITQVIQPGGTIQVVPDSFIVYLPPGGTWNSEFIIGNIGILPLTWTLTHDVDWLSFSDTAGMIQAGLDTNISISINAGSLSIGLYNTSFTLYSNDPNHAAYDIPVELHVSNDADIRVVPDSIHVILPPGPVSITQFRIYNDGLSDLTCQVGNDFQSNWLSPSPRNPAPIAPGTWIDITVTINTGVLSLGDHLGTCFVLATNDPDEYETLIPILVTISEDAPVPAIHIASPTDGVEINTDSLSVEFTVENFNVAEPSNGNGYIKFKLDESLPGIKYDITPLELKSLSEGTHRLQMWLVTNEGADIMPYAGDTCYFSVRIPKPAITCSAAPREYLSYYGGAEPEADTLIIMNTGDAGLHWEIRNNSTWLQVNPVLGSTLPAESDTLAITFNTSELTVGIYMDTLFITSNDPERSLLSIPVTLNVENGSGIHPEGIPIEFALLPNYPNPFNPSTRICFGLPESSDVHFIIFDVMGRKVNEWFMHDQTAGWHELIWDGRNDAGHSVATGVYIYMMKAGEFIESKKMVFMK